MKKILFIIILLLFCPSVYATEETTTVYDVSGLQNSLPKDAQDATAGISPTQNGFSKGINNLLKICKKTSSEELRESISLIFKLFVIAILFSLAASVGGKSAEFGRIGAVLAIATLCLADARSFFAQGEEILRRLDDYSKALLPTLATLATATGTPTKAIATSAVTAFSADVLITLYSRVLMPLLYTYAALVTFNAAVPKDILKRFAGFIKWTVSGILTVSLTLFTAYLTISGVLSGKTDELALKGAKAVISGALPVVGGIISDASDTLLVGAGLLKNSAGIFALIAVLGIVAMPIVAVGIRYLLFKLGAALVGIMGDEKLAAYTDALCSLYALLLGCLGAGSYVFLVSIFAFIKM